MKWIDRISGREITFWSCLACVLVAAARGAGDVPDHLLDLPSGRNIKECHCPTVEEITRPASGYAATLAASKSAINLSGNVTNSPPTKWNLTLKPEPGITVWTITGSGSFNDGSNDDVTWNSRKRSIVLNRHEQLVTNWVTVETIDLTQTNNATRIDRSLQVGKITTNEIVHVELHGQTNTVTFKVGESGYVLQQTVTNEAPSSPIVNGTITHWDFDQPIHR